MNEPIYRITVRRGDRSTVAEVAVRDGRAVHAWHGDPELAARCEQVYERWRRELASRSPETILRLYLVPCLGLVDESAEVHAAFLADCLRAELHRQGYTIHLEDDPLESPDPDLIVA